MLKVADKGGRARTDNFLVINTFSSLLSSVTCLVVQKCIAMGIRSSLIPILINFLSGRSIKVKFNGKQAGPFELVGGSPQGSIIGQLAYTSGSHDNTEHLNILGRRQVPIY